MRGSLQFVLILPMARYGLLNSSAHWMTCCTGPQLCMELDRPAFRSSLYRALVLILYCTGIRFGEALRLRLRDVDTRNGVLFIETFKGRARWVPFHHTMSRELDRYLRERVKYVLMAVA
jgi:integrase